MKPKTVLLGLIIFFACSGRVDHQKDTQVEDPPGTQAHPPNSTTPGMTRNAEIQEIIDRLEKGMIDYMQTSKTAYSRDDVEKCIRIINTYLDTMTGSKDKDEGMVAVKNAVLALNELNKNCKYKLIETDQREDICEIMIIAGNTRGYNERTDDITEEWREW